MKLQDIAGDPKATAKLRHQVHKGTVAAAKAPKLSLGVLGIEIGQEQSTGDTSRPALPWQNKPFMESSESPWHLLLQTLQFVGMKSSTLRSGLGDFAGDDAFFDAVKATKISPPEDAYNMYLALQRCQSVLSRFNLGAADDMAVVAELAEKAGITFDEETNTQLKAALSMVTKHKAIGDHIRAVVRIMDDIASLKGIESHDENYSIAQAFLHKFDLT